MHARIWLITSKTPSSSSVRKKNVKARVELQRNERSWISRVGLCFKGLQTHLGGVIESGERKRRSWREDGNERRNRNWQRRPRRLDWLCCKKSSLAFPPTVRVDRWTHGYVLQVLTKESSSSLIPQERELRDILVLLLSAPPKRGKGTSPLFLRPTFRPRRASPRILLSVTLSCSFDRRVDTHSATVFSPVRTISPSRN